jgi:hypothetical protein
MISSTFKSFGAVCLCLFLGAHVGCFWQLCWLNKSSLPQLLGFRLGMSREELQKKFAGLKVKTDSYTELFISGSNTLPKDQDVSAVDEIGHVAVNSSRFPEFAEINTAELKLEDGRVSQIELTYPDDSRWKSEDDFLTFVAQTLHLPDRRYWQAERHTRYEAQGASVSCNGLTVRAGFHLIIGSAPAPGGPAPIAFPFIVVADDNARRKLR